MRTAPTIMTGARIALLAVASTIGHACAVPRPVVAVPPIAGRVEFPPKVARAVQTSVGYVAQKSTVYLIDPRASQTVASTVSDVEGTFSLSFGGFIPGKEVGYLLEAVKGLSDHQAGHPAVRVRTVVEFRGGGWHSLTGGNLVISRTTTALAVAASLKGASQVPPRSLIGTVTVGAAESSPLPPTPDGFAGVPGLTNAEFHSAFGMVDTALKLDQDPFQVIELGQGGGLVMSAAPKLNVTPSAGANVGDEIILSGGVFDPDPAANQVLFNGLLAQEIQVQNGDSELKVKVPQGATTGPITVSAGSLQYQVPYFLVMPSLAVSVR